MFSLSSLRLKTKTQNKIAISLVLALVISSLTSVQVSAFEGGDGGEETPYRIGDCEQLQSMNDDLDAYYVLAEDVDCSDTETWNGGDGFDPIGSSMVPFTGELDGQNFAITGVYINQPEVSGRGLFGQIGSGDNQVGLVKDLYVEDLNITGNYFVGGVVGELYGQLNRVHAEGQVDGVSEVGGLVGSHGGTFDTIINSRADVDVTGTEVAIGGLAGYNHNDSNIINSYATGTVTGVGEFAQRVGGLVGMNSGNIESSHATGNVLSDAFRVGGLVGRNSGSIQKSYATGSVSGGEDNVGGLVGHNSGGDIYQSYSDNADVEGQSFSVIGNCNVGGLVGSTSSGLIQDSFSRSSVTTLAACPVGGLVGVASSSSTINYTYATGAVSGAIDSRGSFGGQIADTENVNLSFYDTQTSGIADICGSFSSFDCSDTSAISGKTTALMHDIDTFTTELGEGSWDFASTWDIDAGINDNYPYFQVVGAEELDLTPEDEDLNGDEVPDSEQPNVGGYVSSYTGKLVAIDVGEGCELTTDDMAEEAFLDKQDEEYDYENGFWDFEADCGTPGITTPIKLFYYDVDAEDMVLRKYNPNTQTYFTIEDHSISETTINGQNVTVVDYQITDGGELDMDLEENGQIADPAGLGSLVGNNNSETLAETGDSAIVLNAAAILMLASAAAVILKTNLVTSRR